MEGVLSLTVCGGIGRSGLAIGPDGEAVSPRLLARAAAEHAEPVVVGVVVHHQDQDVVIFGRVSVPSGRSGKGRSPRPAPPCLPLAKSFPASSPPAVDPGPACSSTLRHQVSDRAQDRRMRHGLQDSSPRGTARNGSHPQQEDCLRAPAPASRDGTYARQLLHDGSACGPRRAGGLCARSPLRKPAHADERTARKSGASPGLRLKAWRDRCERGRHALGTHRSPPPVVSRGGTAIIDAVHAALMAGFRIPATDKHVRLQVHEPHRLRTRRRWPNLSTRRWCRWAALPVAPSKPSDGSTGRSSTALNRWESLATMSRSPFAEALPKTGVSGVARLRVTSTSG